MVEGRQRRAQIPETLFADITDAPVLDIAPCAAGTAVSFDGVLTAEQIVAVQCRMDSVDAVDEVARNDIRAKTAAVAADPSFEAIAALVVAVANYQLEGTSP